MWVGGHEAVSVSIDGGTTWRQVDSLANRDAMGWGIDLPTLYVSGHPGLTVSSDGGKTFTDAIEAFLPLMSTPSGPVKEFFATQLLRWACSPLPTAARTGES